MKNKTKCVKRDNEQLKAQMANFDKQNEYLVKRYERFDKKLESYENKLTYEDSFTLVLFNSFPLKSQ